MDKRIEKTKKALQEALLDLLKTHSLNDITVTMLCRKANINRNTLYFHYRGVYDILEEIENTLIAEIRPFIGRSNAGQDVSPLTNLCRIYYARKDTLKIIIDSGCDQSFSEKILDIAGEQQFYNWIMDKSGNYNLARKINDFTVAGSISILNTWIQNGFTEPPDTIADFIERSSDAVIKSWLR